MSIFTSNSRSFQIVRELVIRHPVLFDFKTFACCLPFKTPLYHQISNGGMNKLQRQHPKYRYPEESKSKPYGPCFPSGCPSRITLSSSPVYFSLDRHAVFDF